MVELSSSSDPFQHGFPNVVFIVPAIIVVGLGGTEPVFRAMGDVAEEIFNSLGSENGAADGAAAAAAGGGEVPPMMPGGDFKMPTMEEFLSMLEGMDNLSDEEKEELKAGLLQNSMRNRLQAGLSDYLVFFVMISIMLAVFAFFGYKLYLSLTEKERKREEKLKAKQEKSKKKK